MIVRGANRCRRRAFTLIEMCAVMSVFGIAIGFGGAVLLLTMRANQVAGGTLRRVMLTAQTADRFRADVANAVATPDRLGELTQSSTCLILKLPTGDHVAYRWHDHRFERIAVHDDGQTTAAVTTGMPEFTVDFDRPAGDHPLIRMRIVEKLAPGAGRRWEIAAALGGDRR